MKTPWLVKVCLAGQTLDAGKLQAWQISFGGLSVIVVGDIAQLTPVGDKPIYHSLPKTDKQIQGHLMYQHGLKKVVPLIVNHRVGGTSIEQHLFRDLLLRARNSESTPADWHT